MALTRSDNGADFFEKNYNRVYAYIWSMVRDSDEAEDLAQETFLRAHRERETLKDPKAMLSWLYCIATHVSLDWLRKRTKATTRESKAGLADIDPPDLGTPSVQQILEQEEMSACVNRFLVDIPGTFRSVILLHDMHGLTGPEISSILGLPLATVKIRLHRARLRLKAALEAGCKFSCDERGVLVCEPKE